MDNDTPEHVLFWNQAKAKRPPDYPPSLFEEEFLVRLFDNRESHSIQPCLRRTSSYHITETVAVQQKYRPSNHECVLYQKDFRLMNDKIRVVASH